MLGGGPGERLVVAGPQLVGHEGVRAAREVHREGGELAVVPPPEAVGGQRGHHAGVQAARQQAAQRHVGHRLPVHGVGEQVPDGPGRGRQVVGVLPGLKRPVGGGAYPAPADPHVRARPYLGEPPVDAVPRRRGPDLAEQLRQPLGVNLRAELRVREDGLGLGPEQHPVRLRRVVEGLDAQPVPGEQQFLPPPVPDTEREHAVQPAHAVRAPLQVAVQQHLGVRAGTEVVPARRELAAQLEVVVDLPAERQHDVVLTRRPHRLLAARQVDDRQPPVPDRRVRADPHLPGVRPAADHRRRHRRDRGPLPPQVMPEVNPPGDAAHVSSSFSRKAVVRDEGRSTLLSID